MYIHVYIEGVLKAILVFNIYSTAYVLSFCLDIIFIVYKIFSDFASTVLTADF